MRLKVGRWITVVLAWSSLVAVSGCGRGNSGPVARWHGSVTINGQPVPADVSGRIFFTPSLTSAGPTAAPTTVEIVNSQYDAGRVPVGQVSVTFDIKRPTGRTIPRGTSVPLEEYEDLVPERHRSGVLIDVKEEETRHDFEL